MTSLPDGVSIGMRPFQLVAAVIVAAGTALGFAHLDLPRAVAAELQRVRVLAETVESDLADINQDCRTTLGTPLTGLVAVSSFPEPVQIALFLEQSAYDSAKLNANPLPKRPVDEAVVRVVNFVLSQDVSGDRSLLAVNQALERARRLSPEQFSSHSTAIQEARQHASTLTSRILPLLAEIRSAATTLTSL